MRTPISKRNFHKAIQVLQWFDKDQASIYFYGDTKRHHRIEYLLATESREGKLADRWWDGRKIYIPLKHKENTDYEHGLGTTEGLVRLWRADMTVEIIPSRFFRGLNCVPEFGLKYGDKLLLYEFSTNENVKRKLRSKVERYQNNLWKFDDRFNAESFVLFVMDISPGRVKEWVGRLEDLEDFYFVDCQTFKSIPIGGQLTAPIYIWGGDGKEDSLR